MVVAAEHVIHTRADALRFGEENLYIDGAAPFAGPARLEELEKAIRDSLAAKRLLQDLAGGWRSAPGYGYGGYGGCAGRRRAQLVRGAK
ncbi:MAG: hypothetical protein GX492_06530 [Firmicutes bacterium]|nr:hypothetical protein [Bacillota bacterium]